jgi:TPR repeat protein
MHNKKEWKDSLIGLAIIYENGGHGIKRNKKMSIDYYNRASTLYQSTNSDHSKYMLGYLYKNGYGVKCDLDKTLKFW